jgi:hypothetical protein
MINGILGQGKLLGLVIDRAQVEAIVRRPAHDPDARPGVILSEEDWQRRIALAVPASATTGHALEATKTVDMDKTKTVDMDN